MFQQEVKQEEVKQVKQEVIKPVKQEAEVVGMDTDEDDASEGDVEVCYL